MIYPKNLEEKVGFSAIRTLIKDRCLSSLGKAWVDDIVFLTDYKTIKDELTATDEYMQIQTGSDSFPLGGFSDVRKVVAHLRLEGTWMEAQAFVELSKTLKTIYDVVSYFIKKDDDIYPVLKGKSRDVPLFPHHITAINRVVDDNGEVKDSASPALHEIRQSLWREQKNVSRKLEQIMAGAQKAGLVESGVSPSIRDGRLVIPVAAKNKRQINGIIHDESASGKTSFIEPAEVVESNNRIRELELEEFREIIRILTALSNEIRPDVELIVESLNFIGYIDFIRAKARYSLDAGAICPRFNEAPELQWEDARHPLLQENLKKEGKAVVPLNIKLDKDNRIVLISGPNAGGKSVCLKTVGLLQYMFQCGLPVAVNEFSCFGVFHKIFIDIGDDQSLENDLSTYSSHLTNMKFFLRNSDDATLLLVDEFGTGTEPHIGGAIAESILFHLNKNEAFGVFTTHYSNLKHLASSTEGLINGAMLYDQNKMEPLFILEIGKPGSSFAIEIARKIGLPESVISDASEKVGQEHVDFDKHLREITRDKRYWEKKRENIRRQNKNVERLSETFENELSELKKKQKAIVKEAKDEAAAILKQANSTIERTIREIKEAAASKEKTRDIRRHFEEVKEQLTATNNDEPVDKKLQQLIDKADRKAERKKQKPKQFAPQNKPTKAEPITIGDTVKIIDSGAFGEVIEISKKEVVVALGQLQTSIKLSRVEKISQRQKKKESRSPKLINAGLTDEMRDKKLKFREYIDIRGQRADEAMNTITHFMDDAIMCGATQLKILHGTGTGALREMVRQYLNTIDFVSSARDEHVQFGGAGITIVELSY